MLRDRVATLAEMAEAARYFFAAPEPAATDLAAQVEPSSRPALVALEHALATVPWERERLLALIKETAAAHGLKPPKLMMPLRMLVAGTPHTPAIDAVLWLLGRETVRGRMAAGLARID